MAFILQQHKSEFGVTHPAAYANIDSYTVDLINKRCKVNVTIYASAQSRMNKNTPVEVKTYYIKGEEFMKALETTNFIIRDTIEIPEEEMELKEGITNAATSNMYMNLQNHKDFDVRVFIPRYGCINQRRHQLHEVIRLSGINLVINDIDQPLIIKVGSVQKAKLQVYFIDNDEYFKRKQTVKDSKNNIFKDNDERMMFFCQGVLETLIMLRWAPDIIHCNGWISSLVPMYLKEKYNHASIFEQTKIVYSLYKDSFMGSLNKELKNKILFDEINDEHLPLINTPNAKNLHKIAIQYTDFVDVTKSFNNKDILSFIEKKKIESNVALEDKSFEKILEVYNNLCATEVV